LNSQSVQQSAARSAPGRVVVVTGATSGVGRACARAFADDGADVGLIARDADVLATVVDEIRQRGRRAHPVAVDVADAGAVDAAAEEIERELGPIDVWLNDAMTSVFAEIRDTTPEEFARVVQVTCLGSIYGAMAALRRMSPRERGHIIQIGSALAFRGIPLQAAYCTSKHGLNGFYDALRAELHHQKSGLHVSSVHLPAVNTPQFDVVRNKLGHHGQPVPPIYQPEVAARAAVWISHNPRRREIWLGFSTVATILAARIAPGLLDRYLGRTGYKSQQTKVPWPESKPDYVFTPVPGDRGAHGDFDEQAHERTLQFPLTTHRRWVIAGAAAAVAGGLAAAVRAA
jgi:NAD(P)-dependent dehydrogenase (short-subunit alcohol dehydrogenase family)